MQISQLELQGHLKSNSTLIILWLYNSEIQFICYDSTEPLSFSINFSHFTTNFYIPSVKHCLFDFVIIFKSLSCQGVLQGSKHMIIRRSKVWVIWWMLQDLKSQSLNKVKSCSSFCGRVIMKGKNIFRQKSSTAA